MKLTLIKGSAVSSVGNVIGAVLIEWELDDDVRGQARDKVENDLMMWARGDVSVVSVDPRPQGETDYPSNYGLPASCPFPTSITVV